MISYNERVLLVLKEVADQTIAEIADIVQLDSTVIRLRLFAARQKFGWAAAELSRWQHLRCI
jgi:DNA-directed RNA polymerase specialized sigma24 family protein